MLTSSAFLIPFPPSLRWTKSKWSKTWSNFSLLFITLIITLLYLFLLPTLFLQNPIFANNAVWQIFLACIARGGGDGVRGGISFLVSSCWLYHFGTFIWPAATPAYYLLNCELQLKRLPIFCNIKMMMIYLLGS